MIDITEHLPILLIIVTFTSAFMMPLVGSWNKKLCNTFAIITSFIFLLITLLLAKNIINYGTVRYYAGGWEPPYGIELVVDYFSIYLCIIIAFISILVSIYSKHYIEKTIPKGKIVSYYTLLMILIGGMMGVAITGDIFNLFVFTEIFSIAAYSLVAIYNKKESYLASFRYFLLGSLGTSFILLGIAKLYMLTGTLNMIDLSYRLVPWHGSFVMNSAVVFLIMGFCIKAALFPLHTWLPDAYAFAPSSISAILSAIVTKIGAYSIIRVFFTVFGIEFITEIMPLADILAWFSAIAILVGSTFAITQTDLKKMLAYSSVAHVGYVLLGIMVGIEMSATGSIFHMLTHSVAKGCLFFCAGLIIYKTGIRNINELPSIRGKMPITAICFSIAALSIIGIPGTGGFISKFYLVLGMLYAEQWIFVIFILIGSVVSAAFYLKIINLMYFSSDEKKEKVKVDEVPINMLIPTIILAVSCIILGIFPGIVLYLIEPAVELLFGL